MSVEIGGHQQEPVDWRVSAFFHLMKPLPSTGPGVPAHAAGAIGYQASSVSRNSGRLNFIHPSPVAMNLNVAFSAARDAAHLRRAILEKEVATPYGTQSGVTDESIGALFNLFERALVSVQFSYSSLECFANASIGSLLKTKLRKEKKGVVHEFDPPQVERQYALGEKLATVLPMLYGKAPPKGGLWWEKFVAMEQLRNSMVHWKSKDQYQGIAAESEDGTILHDAVNTDTLQYPRLARTVIAYWFDTDKRPPWLNACMSL